MLILEPATDLEIVYSDLYRPVNTRTAAEWLRQGYRVRGDATARLLRLHDTPRGHHRFPDDPIDPDIVQALREQLEVGERPSHQDRRLIERLDAANQANWVNLFPLDAVEPITRPTQSEGWELLVGLWRAGADLEQHIHGVNQDGQKRHWTDGDAWEYLRHRQGLQYIGPRAGAATRMIVIDLDRHDLLLPAEQHIERVLAVLRILLTRHPEFAPHIGALNPSNGSCHIVMYFPRAVPVAEVREFVAGLREECPALQGAEIYPDNLKQVICPLRLDKHTVIDRPLAPTVKAHRYVKPARRKGRKGRGVRLDYRAHDAVAYLEWVQNPDRRPCDVTEVERMLRAACRAGTAVGRVPRTPATRPSKLANSSAPVKFKGQTARVLTDIFSGKAKPDDDTITVYTTVALRALCRVERMDRDEAVSWVMNRLDALEDKTFSDRLVGDRKVLLRNLKGTAKKVWKDNGYQEDGERSNAIWDKVGVAWGRRGFKLSDPSTWDRASTPAVGEPRELVWTDDLLSILPGLTKTANCDIGQARQLLSIICTHVATKNELSLSFLGGLIRGCGLKTCQDKNVAVRRYLTGVGVLRLVRRGFRQIGDDGSGIGNHYILGLGVEFAAVRSRFRLLSHPAKEPLPPASTYVSLTSTQLGAEVLQRRVQDCLAHWYDRLRALSSLREAA